MKTFLRILILFAAAEMFAGAAAAADATEAARVYFQKNVSPDYDKALAALQAAADTEDSDALIGLAELYSNGIGEPRGENDKPINLLRRAAAKGDQWAEPELEWRLRLGIGTEPDLLEAAAYYFRIKTRKLRTPMMPAGAQQRLGFKPNVRAMLAISRQSELRHHPNRETLERLDKLFEDAFTGKNNAALLELAKLHEQGIHGKPNLSRAYAILTIANSPETAAKANQLNSDGKKAMERDLQWIRSASIPQAP